MSTKPTTVEIGQMYQDVDNRSHGSGEFTVVAVLRSPTGEAKIDDDLSEEMRGRTEAVIARARKSPTALFPLVVIYRSASDRTYRMSMDRLMGSENDSRGYKYLGKKR